MSMNFIKFERLFDSNIFPIEDLNKIVEDKEDGTKYFTFMINNGIYEEYDYDKVKGLIKDRLYEVDKNAIIWEDGYEDHTDIEDYYCYYIDDNNKRIANVLKTFITTVVII